MKPSFGKDLTAGSVPKQLTGFALPILLGNILSTGYSIINAIWVGRLLGKDAVGAVAVSFPIFLGLVALCSGATLATSILISKAYGEGEPSRIQRIVNNSWSIAVILIVLVTAGGLLASKPLLRMLGTPDELMPLATGYLNLTIAGFAGLYLSHLIAAILRGIGDTMIPLIFIILSTVMNALLDPLLIAGIGPLPRLGLNGAAAASILSSTTAVVLGMLYMLRKYAKQPLHPRRFILEKSIVTDMLRIGLPSFVQQMLISLGYAFITVFVNRFGSASIAAFGVASRIDSLAAMPGVAMMMATSNLTAQNLGAGKRERVKQIFKWGLVLNTPLMLILSALCMAFPAAIMGIFVSEPEVIQAGIGYLRMVGAGYLFFIVLYVSNGVINGAGRTISTMLITFLSLCIVRIPLAAWLSHTGLEIQGIWLSIVISMGVSAAASLLYYSSGKWLGAVKRPVKPHTLTTE